MSIWKSIGHFFGNLFQKVQHVAEEYAPKAIELVNNIKAYDTANPGAADIISKIIPGTWDDDLKNKARLALPNILKDLGIANECAQIADINAFLKCVLDKINSLAPEIRGLYWHNLAILITNAISDGQATIPEITGIIQAVYQEVEKQKRNTLPNLRSHKKMGSYKFLRFVGQNRSAVLSISVVSPALSRFHYLLGAIETCLNLPGQY